MIRSEEEMLIYLEGNIDKISEIANGFNAPARSASVKDVVLAMAVSLAAQAGGDTNKLARWISYILIVGELHTRGVIEFDLHKKSEMH